MKRIAFLFVVVAGLVTVLNAQVMIAAGEKGGTYFPFSEQIGQECGSHVNGLGALETDGSLRNIELLVTNPKVKFSMVQYDALTYLLNSKKYSDDIKEFVRKLRVVTPLYNEEIHIVVNKRRGIHSLKDLKNKKVAVGKLGSGSYVTSKYLASLTGVKFRPYAYSIKKAIGKIVSGEIDAAIYVAGAPASIFAKPKKSGKYHKVYNLYKQNLTLLPIGDDEGLEGNYDQAYISAKDYEWLDSDVKTRSIRSLLITFNYTPEQSSYKRVKNLYACLYKNIERFQLNTRFHQKWIEVDSESFDTVEWPVHPAVIEYLQAVSAVPKNMATIPGTKKKHTEALSNFFDDL